MPHLSIPKKHVLALLAMLLCLSGTALATEGPRYYDPLGPQAEYERTGDVPNVAFPCAALLDDETGRLAIYYGGADTVICLAFGYVNDVVDFVKSNPSRL